MKKLLLITVFTCLTACVMPVFAEGPIIDPTITSERTLTCTLPVEFTDNTPIPVGGVTEVRFKRSTDGLTWVQIGTSTECRYVDNISELPEGQYYYTATAIAQGQESANSNVVAQELRITRIPKPVTTLGWE